ncbi:MAG: hypothetical protein GY715_10835 [Planctomycetes bacterium]|nr:hypothetical protein [Planctomycetota bacterium]
MPRPPRQRCVAENPEAAVCRLAGVRGGDLQWTNLPVRDAIEQYNSGQFDRLD